MSEIARYYNKDKNDERHPRMLPGVPLRDLSEEEFNGYPEWLQRSIDNSDLYRKSKPRSGAGDKSE